MQQQGYAAGDTRSTLRQELDRRRRLRGAQALLDTHAVERKLEWEAREEMRRSGKITARGAARRQTTRDLAAALRRDSLRDALAYPMSPDELVAACRRATLAARVSTEAFEDVSQALVLAVIRKHGPSPLRADVGMHWLQRRAAGLLIDQERAKERSTGARAVAAELSHGKPERRAVMAAVSGDRVWALAAIRPAPEDAPGLDPASAAKRLGLSERQSAALALAISSGTRPMSTTERVQWLNARRTLRQRFPSPWSLILAWRPDAFAARILTDAAIRSAGRTLPRAEVVPGMRAEHGSRQAKRVA